MSENFSYFFKARFLSVAILAVLLPFSASAKPFLIMTSFYPLYVATLNITEGVDGVAVENLAAPSAGCLHDYQLSPKELLRLSKADALVVNGAGAETFLPRISSVIGAERILTATEGIPLLPGTGETEQNPHVWTSPALYGRMVENIAEKLAALQPKNGVRYRANAENYVKKLAALSQKMKAGLANLKSRDIITLHEAFPYFAREFGLNIAAVIMREPGSEPNARELSEVILLARRSGIKALFAEPQYSAKAATAIAAETGAKVYTLNPIVDGPNDKNAYVSIMEENLAEIKRALGK